MEGLCLVHLKAFAIELRRALEDAVLFLRPGVVFGDPETVRQRAEKLIERAGGFSSECSICRRIHGSEVRHAAE